MGQRLFDKIHHAKKRAFLAAYATCGHLSQAAQLAGCSRHSHYHWLADPAYAEAWDAAQRMAADVLEDEATRRALGWEETRYSADGTAYTVHKYSDVLLIVRLKALYPDKYRERYDLEHSGKPGGAPLLVERLQRAHAHLEERRHGDRPGPP